MKTLIFVVGVACGGLGIACMFASLLHYYALHKIEKGAPVSDYYPGEPIKEPVVHFVTVTGAVMLVASCLLLGVVEG